MQKLTVPKEKDTIFVNPEFSLWDRLLSENKCILEKQPDTSTARQKLLNIAEDYTRTITAPPYSGYTIKNVIVTGHQPVWHHCGILAKNLIASKFAQLVKGSAVQLVLDHDICDTALAIPKHDSNGSWYIEKIKLENKQSSLPLEFRPVPQTERIKHLIDTVIRTDKNRFCCNVWSEHTPFKACTDASFRNIADLIRTYPKTSIIE